MNVKGPKRLIGTFSSFFTLWAMVSSGSARVQQKLGVRKMTDPGVLKRLARKKARLYVYRNDQFNNTFDRVEFSAVNFYFGENVVIDTTNGYKQILDAPPDSRYIVPYSGFYKISVTVAISERNNGGAVNTSLGMNKLRRMSLALAINGLQLPPNENPLENLFAVSGSVFTGENLGSPPAILADSGGGNVYAEVVLQSVPLSSTFVKFFNAGEVVSFFQYPTAANGTQTKVTLAFRSLSIEELGDG